MGDCRCGGGGRPPDSRAVPRPRPEWGSGPRRSHLQPAQLPGSVCEGVGAGGGEHGKEKAPPTSEAPSEILCAGLAVGYADNETVEEKEGRGQGLFKGGNAENRGLALRVGGRFAARCGALRRGADDQRAALKCLYLKGFLSMRRVRRVDFGIFPTFARNRLLPIVVFWAAALAVPFPSHSLSPSIFLCQERK